MSSIQDRVIDPWMDAWTSESDARCLAAGVAALLVALISLLVFIFITVFLFGVSTLLGWIWVVGVVVQILRWLWAEITDDDEEIS